MADDHYKRVINRAFDICQQLGKDEAFSPTRDPQHAPDLHVLAVAFSDVVDRYLEVADRPKQNRCGWCVKSAGSTDAAWREAVVYSLDEVQAHTLVCEHNPLVAELARVRPVCDVAKALAAEYRERGAKPSALKPLVDAVDAAIGKEPP